jgi:hypothetical protein
MWGVHGSPSDQVVKKRHANGKAIGYLLKYGTLRTVRDGWIDFQTANHWSRMHHERIGSGKSKALGSQLVAKHVLVNWKSWFINSLRLCA